MTRESLQWSLRVALHARHDRRYPEMRAIIRQTLRLLRTFVMA